MSTGIYQSDWHWRATSNLTSTCCVHPFDASFLRSAHLSTRVAGNQTSNKRVSHSESWWVLSIDESSLRRAHVSQTQSNSTRELLAAEPQAKESPPAHDQSRTAPRLRHCQLTISLGQNLVSDTASTRSVSPSPPGIFNVPQGVARRRRSTPHKAPSTR